MAYAYCNNEDCEKDKWWLQKPPEEYAAGGPKCPECGTTRVTLDSAQQSGAEAPPEPRERAAAEASPPARAESSDGTRGGTAGSVPDTVKDHRDAVEAGQKTGSLLMGLAGGTSPEEKAEAQSKAFTAVGSAIASIGQQAAQRQKEGAKRAKETQQEYIKPVDDYVSCPGCEAQITNLPPSGSQFRCPGCGMLLEHT